MLGIRWGGRSRARAPTSYVFFSCAFMCMCLLRSVRSLDHSSLFYRRIGLESRTGVTAAKLASFTRAATQPWLSPCPSQKIRQASSAQKLQSLLGVTTRRC